MARAGEGTGHGDVGDQILIRELLAAFLFFCLGLSLSKLGRRSCDRLHSAIGSSPRAFSSVACQFSFGDLAILTGPSRHADVYCLA